MPDVDLSPFVHLYPYASNYIDLDGLAYHYLDEGQGEPMVMVHGNPTWSFYFRSLVNAFSDHYRVIVPDHIGCGLSSKPAPQQYPFRLQQRVDDLSCLMDHLQLPQPVTLVVHDWGGMIGLAWALDHPERVRRIVVLNTAGFFPPRLKPIPKRLRLIRSGFPMMRSAVLKLNLFARVALYMAPRKTLAVDVKAGLIAPYASVRNRWATLKFVEDIPLSKKDPSGAIVDRVDRHLEHICHVPTLILWGKHDFVFDIDYFQEWCRRLPHAEAHLFNDAGHYLLEDIPDKIIMHMEAFLQHPPANDRSTSVHATT
jgi:pimeloyl-ACP methyl ester carboxylesterase